MVGLASATTIGGVLTTAPTAAADGPAPLHGSHGRAVSGQYIVVLDDGADGAAVARRNGVSALRVYTSALDGFAVRLTPGQLARVRRDQAVKYVTPDEYVSINNKPTPPGPGTAPRNGGKTGPHGDGVTGQTVQTPATWGLDRVDQRARPLNNTYRYTSTGGGVNAYVIDTGIRTAHTDFGGRAVSGFTSIADGRGAQDCNGHGTHVAGTIGGTTYGVAKSVRLVAVRVLDCGGSGTWAGVIAGVDWVTQTHNGPAVANMSLGGGFNQAVNDAVSASIAEGVVYSIAAGNSNDNACNYSPASTPAALTVAATDINDARASFSNYGACVDVFAPGVNIVSDWWTSNTATATLSGTSMAAPHVAGLVAQHLQTNRNGTQATLNQVLVSTAATGLVTNPGAGSPNRLARRWNGTLSATGASSYEPDGSYWYQANAGYIRGWLFGVTGTDPDLYLQRWNGSAWVNVAVSASTTAQERVVYNAPAASYYRFQVYQYAGGGPRTYDVWTTHPS